MSKRAPRGRDDRGAALVTVLTMLTFMSALAVVVVDAADFSIRRTANLTRMEQSRWYLLGAEAFAAAKLEDLRRRSETARINQNEWQGRPFLFPLDDGAMEVAILDGSNCFNLNSIVVSEDGGARTPSARGMFQFARLLDTAEARGARAGLAAALADWVDSDRDVTAGGAEDSPYRPHGGQYVAANTFIADIGELSSISGFDAETIARIAPFVCVRPTSAPNLINPNTLTPDQAPLLAAAMPDLTVDAAAQIIRDRPRGGWEDIESFLAHPRLNSGEMTEATRAQFSLQSRYYVLRVRVQREQGAETSAALIEVGSGRATVLRRVFGAGRVENRL